MCKTDAGGVSHHLNRWAIAQAAVYDELGVRTCWLSFYVFPVCVVFLQNSLYPHLLTSDMGSSPPEIMDR